MSPGQPDERSEYDSPWKDFMDRYFIQFVEFYFPELYAEIDWNLEYEFLDSEFQKITRDSKVGRRLADKLAQVRTLDAKPLMILAHIEIQAGYEADFAERIYVYNYRIYDRYKQQVISLAVLADDNRSWRPTSFGWQRGGFSLSMNFPVVKLLDYTDLEKLEQHPNPFAIVTLAHLKAMETRKDMVQRYKWRWHLIRILYDRGYTRQEIVDLCAFIDWVMTLPKELEARLLQNMKNYEEKTKMRYLTSMERMGILNNTQHMVTEALKVKFPEISDHLLAAVAEIENMNTLNYLHRQVILKPSVEAFEAEFQNCMASA